MAEITVAAGTDIWTCSYCFRIWNHTESRTGKAATFCKFCFRLRKLMFQCPNCTVVQQFDLAILGDQPRTLRTDWFHDRIVQLCVYIRCMVCQTVSRLCPEQCRYGIAVADPASTTSIGSVNQSAIFPLFMPPRTKNSRKHPGSDEDDEKPRPRLKFQREDDDSPPPEESDLYEDLFSSVASNSISSVSRLLDKHADLIDIDYRNIKDGQTLLFVAVRERHGEMAQMLASRGASSFLIDSKGETMFEGMRAPGDLMERVLTGYRDRTFAFATGLHPRLGQDSIIYRMLANNERNIIRLLFSMMTPSVGCFSVEPKKRQPSRQLLLAIGSIKEVAAASSTSSSSTNVPIATSSDDSTDESKLDDDGDETADYEFDPDDADLLLADEDLDDDRNAFNDQSTNDGNAVVVME